MAEGKTGVLVAKCHQNKATKEKVTKKIRGIFFFDGTMNNQFNTAVRKVGLSDKNLNKYIADPDSSYNNDYSNVSFLFHNFDVLSTSNYDLEKAIYTEGIGTIDYNRGKDKGDDSTIGFALGMGATGIAGKVDNGINSFLNLIQQSFDPSDNLSIIEIRLDVFGFSRGAAAARNFIQVALHGFSYHDAQGPIVAQSIKQRLHNLKYNVACEVKVEFVGLFDTVSSLDLTGTLHEMSNVKDLGLDSIKEATYVYHLASAHEHRKNFALTDVTSAKAGKEIFLPGVHCDIGGSYEDFKGQEIELIEKHTIHIFGSDISKIDDEVRGLSKEGWFEWTDIYHKKSTAEKPIFLAEDDSIDNAMAFHTFLLPHYELHIRRKPLSSRYSRIPLQLMSKKAESQHQVNFNKTLYTNVNTTLKEPFADDYILQAKKLLESYANGTSKISDWFTSTPLLRALKKHHLHFSANYSKPFGAYDPRYENGKRTRKIHEG